MMVHDLICMSETYRVQLQFCNDTHTTHHIPLPPTRTAVHVEQASPVKNEIKNNIIRTSWGWAVPSSGQA